MPTFSISLRALSRQAWGVSGNCPLDLLCAVEVNWKSVPLKKTLLRSSAVFLWWKNKFVFFLFDPQDVYSCIFLTFMWNHSEERGLYAYCVSNFHPCSAIMATASMIKSARSSDIKYGKLSLVNPGRKTSYSVRSFSHLFLRFSSFL